MFAPVYYLLGSGVAWNMQAPVLLALLSICALLIWRHRANLRRLLSGTEPRIGKNSSG